MSSSRGLLALSVIAAALVAAVVLDDAGPAAPAVRSRHVVPAWATGFDLADLASVRWRRPGRPDVAIVRQPDGTLALEDSPGTVDLAAVRDVVQTLSALTYRRATPLVRDRGLSAPRLVIEVVRVRGPPQSLAVGAHIPELDRVWTAVADRAYLVEGYAIRALDRSADDLRERRVFRVRDSDTTGIEIAVAGAPVELIASGRPLAVHLPAGAVEGAAAGRVRADPAAVERVAELLDRIRLRSFSATADALDAHVPAPPGAVSARVIGASDAELIERGPCPERPGLRLVATTVGAGCVASGELAALAALTADPLALLARTALPGDARPVELTVRTLDSTLVVTADGAGWTFAVGSSPRQPAEASAVQAAVSSLAGAGDARYAARPTGPPRWRLAVGYAGGDSERVEVHARALDALVCRDGEPVCVIADAALARAPTALELRARLLLAREPTALRAAIARRGGAVVEHVARGDTLDEWRVVAPDSGVADPTRIAALRELVQLSALRFTTATAGLARPRRTVVLELDAGPLSAEPVRHTIAIGADTEDGCIARVDDGPVVAVLGRAACDAALGPWVSR